MGRSFEASGIVTRRGLEFLNFDAYGYSVIGQVTLAPVLF